MDKSHQSAGRSHENAATRHRDDQASVFRHGLAAVLLLLAGGVTVFAQSPGWKPEKNVELIVGTTAGSSLDRTTRALQKIWQDRGVLGVASAVVNKPGGNMGVAAAYLSQHAGDPHYFQVISPTLLTNHINGGGTYNYTDFTPMALLGNRYVAIAARADSPIKSGKDLLEQLKRDPAAVSFGINGVGNNLHILIAVVGKAAGADVKKIKTVVFAGGELITAAIGGHVDLISTVTSNILPQVQAGKLRMLGVASSRRLGGALADFPTWREQGVDAVVQNWATVLGAKGLTAAQIAYWDGVFATTTSTEEWKTGLVKSQWEVEYLNSADTTAYLRNDYKNLRAALADLGLAKR